MTAPTFAPLLRRVASLRFPFQGIHPVGEHLDPLPEVLADSVELQREPLRDARDEGVQVRYELTVAFVLALVEGLEQVRDRLGALVETLDRPTEVERIFGDRTQHLAELTERLEVGDAAAWDEFVAFVHEDPFASVADTPKDGAAQGCRTCAAPVGGQS